MDWIHIKDVIPNRPTMVLLYASYEARGSRADAHVIGELGGAKNAPEVAVDLGDGNKKIVSASHWCKLVAP